MSLPIERARGVLAGAASVVVLGHQRPDGDSVGSMLGLMLALRERGQQAVAVSSSGIPARFEFLPGAGEVLRELPGGEHLLVALDSADAERLSAEVKGQVAINIDHHPTNTEYAELNLVVPDAAATTQILFNLSEQLELPISSAVASCYLAGLITDTNGFRTPSVNAAALRVAAELIELGADLSTLYQRALIEHSFVALRYWGAGLTSLQRQGKLAWANLSLEDRREVGYPGDDDADLVEMLATIREASVSLIFVELGDERVKVSWRAREGVNVAEVASGFGGGGHHLAAGATVDGRLAEVIERVVSATQLALERAAE